MPNKPKLTMPASRLKTTTNRRVPNNAKTRPFAQKPKPKYDSQKPNQKHGQKFATKKPNQKPHQKHDPKKPNQKQGEKPNQRPNQKHDRKQGQKHEIALDSRMAALHILRKIIVTDRGEPMDRLIAGYQPLQALDKRGKAFARLLIATCLRRYGQTNKILDNMLSPETAIEVRLVLILGGVQLLFLDTRPHAATDTAVEMTKTLGFPRQAGLVNAVLRKIIREKDHVLDNSHSLDNLPPLLKTRLIEAWGEEAVAQISDMIMRTPPLDISVKHKADEIAQQLDGMVINTMTVRTNFDGDIRMRAGYDEGEWWVQDSAAAMAVQMLGELKGKKIWDLCAAPGGKTMQLAHKGGEILAVDHKADRLEILRANLSRTGLSARIKQADILSPDFDAFARQAPPDLIILDAPCSATGTIRRRPDILIGWEDERALKDGQAMQNMQNAMLEKAMQWIKIDGVVMFVTCSLLPAEGEDIITALTTQGRAKILPFTKDEAGCFADSLHAQGWLRIMPYSLAIDTPPFETGCDGFFIARLTKPPNP